MFTSRADAKGDLAVAVARRNHLDEHSAVESKSSPGQPLTSLKHLGEGQ